MSNNASITRVDSHGYAKDTRPAGPRPLQPVTGPVERFPLLDLRYDGSGGILWKFISDRAPAHFNHELLNDLRGVQNALIEGEDFGFDDYHPDDVKFLVLASHRPKVFSLGGDLALFRELIQRRDRHALAAYAKKCIDAVYHHATGNSQLMTTISLVQGVALGGGFEAALAGQVMIAERGARFGLPEVIFGLFPGMGAYTLLRQRVDAKTAERMILTAETYSAEQLFDFGIVDELAYPGEGEQTVMEYVRKQRLNPGQHAFRKALNRVNAIDHAELYGIADEWVEAAMDLSPANLRRIDRLLRSQARYIQ